MSNYSKDYYRILQVHPDAEEEVIQAAYRRLALKYHPDIGQDTGLRMQEINEAYDTLSDTAEREHYNRWYRMRPWRKARVTGTESTTPHPERPPYSPWRVVLPTAVVLGLLSILVLDIFRLGLRGLPEITLLLILLGLVVYYFGGFKDLWR